MLDKPFSVVTKKSAVDQDVQPQLGRLVEELFNAPQGIDSKAIGAACADSIKWEDMASGDYFGPAQVQAMMASKFPEGSRLVVERIAGNATTGGFTWRRQAVGDSSQYGLRGTTYLRLDDDGRLAYVREGSEPIVKPGELTERLLKAVTANVEPSTEKPTYTPAQPTTAKDIVEYLWLEAYPKGAKPDVALDLFARDIRYEDFNYPRPFLGKDQVKEFVEAFDIPGISFVPLEISGGANACCFTWKVTINEQDGPSGISFYQVDDQGKVAYIRDIPAVKPAPLQRLAALLNPKLCVFKPRPAEAPAA